MPRRRLDDAIQSAEVSRKSAYSSNGMADFVPFDVSVTHCADLDFNLHPSGFKGGRYALSKNPKATDIRNRIANRPFGNLWILGIGDAQAAPGGLIPVNSQ